MHVSVGLRTLAGLAAGAALSVLALSVWYARHPTLALEMDRETPGVITGLYRGERAGDLTFAWTQRTATLTLPGIDRSEEWVCTIRLRGARADVSTLPVVLISVDGVIATGTQTTNEYQEVSARVPARPGTSTAVMALTVSSTFVPGPSDSRTLGVMVDRWTCEPASSRGVWPPHRAMAAAAAGGAAFGAAFALLGAGVLATIGAVALLASAQAVPLAWETAPFTPYVVRAIWLAVWTAALLVAGVRAGEWMAGRRFSNAARSVAACTAAVLYLKLLALVHPSKPLIDALFHAHRLEWVLDGRFFFTQPMPSGVHFPYAIGLYVFAAPWSLLTDDDVLLLRIVVSTAEAIGGLLVYSMVSRMWGDRLAGVIAAILFHLVPRTFNIAANANMTNAFAQSVAFAVLSMAVLSRLQRGDRRQFAGLTILTAWALLSHISTFTLLGGILMVLALLYWWRGGPDLRRPAASVFASLVIAGVISVFLYYGHFGDAYRSALRVRASSTTADDVRTTEQSVPQPSDVLPTAAISLEAKLLQAGRLTILAVGWPILLMSIAGMGPFWRRGVRDRLSLGVLALLITFTLFVLSVVVTPVERSFQRYAEEFISRVTLATYPAGVMLAGLGAATLWRVGVAGRLAAGALLSWALYVGVTAWVQWLQ